MGNISNFNVPTDYATVQAAANAVAALGMTNDDTSNVHIEKGNYLENVSIVLSAGTVNFIGMDEVNINRIKAIGPARFTVEGVGLLEFGYSGGLGYQELVNCNVDHVQATGSISTIIQRCEMISGYFYDVNFVGLTDFHSDRLRSQSIYTMILTSGNLSSPEYNSLTYTSNLIINNCYSSYNQIGQPTLDIRYCSGVVMNHCTLVNLVGHSLNSHNCYEPIKVYYSILAASGTSPVSTFGLIKPWVSGCCLYNYLSPTSPITTVSGQFIQVDPMFIDILSGNIRVDVNSPCACAADYIDTNANADNIVRSQLNEQAIKFYVMGHDYKAVRPSGIYIIQEGNAVFFASGANLDPNMDVFVYNQFILEDTVTTISSLTNTIKAKHPYPYDYLLMDRMNFRTNQIEKYIMPYTMIPLNSLLAHSTDQVTDVVVSGYYINNGFSRDHIISPEGNSIYWIGEKNNSYIRQYDALTNKLLNTYYLLPYADPSGYKSLGIGDSIYPFIPTAINPNLELRALLDYKDWLYVLVKQVYRYTEDLEPSEEFESYATHLYVYNKFSRYPFEAPVTMISGIVDIAGNNATDMSVDDEGSLYISSSGQINKYSQKYDYALITRTQGTKKTTITFREPYTGVNL